MDIEDLKSEFLKKLYKDIPLEYRNDKLRVFTEIDLENDCKHINYYVFPLDRNMEFDSKSRNAMNVFSSSSKNYNYSPKKKTAIRLFVDQRIKDFISEKIHNLNFFKEDIFSNVKIIYVDSIFDFFEKVGFDYRSKTWISYDLESGNEKKVKPL